MPPEERANRVVGPSIKLRSVAFFWVNAAVTVVRLALSDSAFLAKSFGDGASRRAPVSTVPVCSGSLLRHDDPVEKSEYGQWTNKQLFYAVVFAISSSVVSVGLAVRHLLG